MVELAELWLPILLSGVAVFFVSFLMWVAMPHHKSDWSALPDEDAVMDALRNQGARGPGQYMFPHCSSKEQMRDPAFVQRYAAGPKGLLVLREQGPASMGASMVKSFLFNVVTAALVAYVATMGVERGVDGAFVFRFVTTVAFLANSVALVWGPIWFSRSWSSTFKEMADGFVYALVTGGIFTAFWPAIA